MNANGLEQLGFVAHVDYRLEQHDGDIRLFWLSDKPQPTTEEISDAAVLWEAEYKATEYQRLRSPEYPPVEDYLDGIVKGDQAQVQKYIDDCLAVKAKYPKGVA